jgi:hypothetical protein
MSSQLAAAVLLYEQSTCIAGFDQTPEPCDYAKVSSFGGNLPYRNRKEECTAPKSGWP